MGRAICSFFIACLVAGCPAVRPPGPTVDEVGKIFTWKMHDTISVTDSGCPSQANFEDLKRDLPASHQFIRLDSTTSATYLHCPDVADVASCVEHDETASIYFSRDLAVAGVRFSGEIRSTAAQLATNCSLMLDSTFNLEDKGSSATLTLWLVYRKQDVAYCLPAQLVDPGGNVVDGCSAKLTGDLDLVSVRDGPG